MALPLTTLNEKPLISVETAVQALIDHKDELYVDGRYPVRAPFEYNQVRLAYGVTCNESGCRFEPVYAFVHETGDWDLCLLVNALTGELYPAISAE